VRLLHEIGKGSAPTANESGLKGEERREGEELVELLDGGELGV
jgi:hypothetical protein